MTTTRTGPLDSTEAFRRLFGQTYPSIVAYARRRVAPDQVDDVVSEVFATAWRRRREFDPARLPTDAAGATIDPDRAALPWLYGMAANVVRNLRRADGRHLRLVERIEAQPPTDLGPDPADEAGGDLRAALDRLSFDDQEVLRLVAWEGLSHAEAGHVLDCSTNAVGIRIHRARQRLEVELDRLANPLDPTADPVTPRTDTDRPTRTDEQGER